MKDTYSLDESKFLHASLAPFRLQLQIFLCTFPPVDHPLAKTKLMPSTFEPSFI